MKARQIKDNSISSREATGLVQIGIDKFDEDFQYKMLFRNPDRRRSKRKKHNK